ncbi:MAG: hypothetical protein FJ189_09765, partial [Gammaproteobacteria bacterium]|nr:hypothetical protein [Gammaproteobacteria bacterium]
MSGTTVQPSPSAIPVAAAGIQSESLVRRFVALPLDKKRQFIARLAEQGIDFSVLPIPMGLAESEACPLSYAQQSLYVLWSLLPDSAAYHMAGGVRLRGVVDARAVRRSFEVLCGRHEQLRTTFGAADGQPFQRIAVSAAVVWRELDLSPGAGGAAWDEAQR